MAAQLGTHLSADAVRGFAAGTLDDSTAAVIMTHLDDCPAWPSAIRPPWPWCRPSPRSSSNGLFEPMTEE